MIFEKKIHNWCKLKENILNIEKNIFFNEREIWWCNCWVNIWFEENWKWENFSRPFLILKKFSKEIFLWIPLTSKIKSWKYFFEINFLNKLNKNLTKNSVLLLQSKTLSKKRLLKKIWTLDQNQFLKLKKEFKNLI